MGTYVTDTGFARQTYNDIRSRLVARSLSLFGSAVDTTAGSPLGNILDVLAYGLGIAWEGAEETYNAHAISLASGASLDKLGELGGAFRVSAAPSRVAVVCVGDVGTVLAADRQIRLSGSNLVFASTGNVTLQQSSCRRLVVEATGSTGAAWSVTTPEQTYSGTLAATDPLDAIATLMSADTYVDAVVLDDQLVLTSVDDNIAMSVSGGLNIASVGVETEFVCTQTGANIVDIDSSWSISTPVSGWDSAINLSAGILGRLVETDEEYRVRIYKSYRVGRGTDFAIEQYILNNAAGVTSARCISNRSSGVDGEGRPPHSFEVMVVGGESAQIAEAIWASMPSGIEPFGSESVEVTDSEGYPQTVSFSRPTPVYVHYSIVVSAYAEEVLPDDWQDQVRAAIVLWAVTEFTLGKDVIPQRVSSPIYTIPGIGSITTLQVATTPGPNDTPTWTTSPVAIGGRGVGRVLAENIALAVSA